MIQTSKINSIVIHNSTNTLEFESLATMIIKLNDSNTKLIMSGNKEEKENELGDLISLFHHRRSQALDLQQLLSFHTTSPLP